MCRQHYKLHAVLVTRVRQCRRWPLLTISTTSMTLCASSMPMCDKLCMDKAIRTRKSRACIGPHPALCTVHCVVGCRRQAETMCSVVRRLLWCWWMASPRRWWLAGNTAKNSVKDFCMRQKCRRLSFNRQSFVCSRCTWTDDKPSVWTTNRDSCTEKSTHSLTPDTYVACLYEGQWWVGERYSVSVICGAVDSGAFLKIDYEVFLAHPVYLVKKQRLSVVFFP